MITWAQLLVLFVGGGTGTICRYLIYLWFTKPDATLPWGTLVANIVSSFLIGAFAAYFMKHSNETLRLLLVTGYCGGFSTFSTFSMENLQLLQEGKWIELSIYVALSIFVCVFSVFAGMKIVG